MHEFFRNPLWWVIPAILIASWVYNHRDFSSPSGSSEKKGKKPKEEPTKSEAPAPAQSGSDSEPGD